jgi:murein DD-endopeptidase MepM/ murein hydrolase activator NlpD
MAKILLLIIILLILLTYFIWQENKRLKNSVLILQNELDNTKIIIASMQSILPSENEKALELNNLQRFLSQTPVTNPKSDHKTIINSEQIRLQQLPSTMPLEGDYAISQHFGPTHQGLDFAAAKGTKVLAAGLGAVVSVSTHPQLGNVIEIDHLNGYRTIYAHLLHATVEAGQLIKQGETIGFVGNTGRSSAPHLHFEIIQNDKRRNPAILLGLE